MRSAVRFGVLTFVGMLLLQTAWILAVPPYHAIDEFDHAYRAAGVAHGQWVLTEQPDNGRGLAVAVPRDMVEAASAQCESLKYTQFANCHPVEERADGLVVVATAAAPYNPLYYAVVGTAAEPFDAVAADYVMRGVSALICALAIAISAFCLALMRAGPWTRLGFMVSMTPMLVYTTSVPAPNSLEIVTALMTWCALLAVASGRLEPPWERRLVWLAGAAAVATVVPRTLGPMWLAVVGLVLAVFVGRRRLVEIVRAHTVPVVVCLALVVLATLGSAAWSAWTGLFAESPDVAAASVSVDPVESLQPVVWTLQIIGAFPFRGSPAPMGVYVLYLLAVVPFLVAGVRRTAGRERVAVLGAVALTILLPIGLTLATAASQGPIWQGRYQLPLVVGILLMCGLALDRRPPGRLAFDAAVVCALVVTAAQAWSVVHVRVLEGARTDVLGPDPAWATLHPVLLAGLTVAGGAVLAADPLRRLWSQRPPRVTSAEPASAPAAERVSSEHRGGAAH
jgi:hypothetical protein